MKKIHKKSKNFIVYFLCTVILCISLSEPLIVSASMPSPLPAATAIDVIFAVLDSIGSTIFSSTALDMSINDGNPFTEHDAALFAYDYLQSKGFGANTLDTFCKIIYSNPDWKEPISINDIDFYDWSRFSRDELLNYEKTSEFSNAYISFKPESKSIFDTLGDFVSSVLDGTNKIQIGGKDITAEAVKGWTGDYERDSKGNIITRVALTATSVGVAVSASCNVALSNTKGVCFYRSSHSGSPGFFEYIGLRHTSSGFFESYFPIVFDGLGNPVSSSKLKYISSFTSNLPIFSSVEEARAFLSSGSLEGILNGPDSVNSKFDHKNLAQDVALKLFPFISGAAVSVKGLYDAYVKTKGDVTAGTIVDNPSYIESIGKVIQGIQTIDKAITEEKPLPLPDTSDLLEWIKTIATVVVNLPSELRRISLTTLENSVGAIADTFPAIRQDLKSITDVFPAISMDLKSITDGFPAIRDKLGMIADGFPALKQNLQSLADGFPALRQDLKSITDIFPSFVDYQTQVLPKIVDMSLALTGVASMFKDYADGFTDYSTDLKGILGSILDALSFPISGVLDIPISDVAAKVDGITDAITGIGDLSISIPDYSGFLKTIIAILTALFNAVTGITDWFSIDVAAISDALADVKTDMFRSSFAPFFVLLDKFHFTDNYEYPKLTFPTPKILQPFYSEAVIVLCDFGDFAKYFIWVRTILKFVIHSGFIWWVIKQFKVVLSIA